LELPGEQRREEARERKEEQRPDLPTPPYCSIIAGSACFFGRDYYLSNFRETSFELAIINGPAQSNIIATIKPFPVETEDWRMGSNADN